jgi:hypothetical protein
MDELETFEARRNTRPLTVPVLIERDSRFLVWTESAPIRPRGKMSPARARAVLDDEKRLGKRRDRSRWSLSRTLARAAALVREHERVELETDKKTIYVKLAEEAFGKERLVHRTTSSKLPRDVKNPLFPINQTEALCRDLTGRMRRESWLVSKQRRYLDLALQIFAAYRNYVRLRFNHDWFSPAQRLGFVQRTLTPNEILSWRQDWGARSIHPLSRFGEVLAAPSLMGESAA